MLDSTTNNTLHGKNIVHMTRDKGEEHDTLHFFYDASNKPAIVEYNGVKYAYVHNLQGDIVAILDSNGTAVVNYKYDAWGEPFTPTGSMATSLGKYNPFRYRGYVYDEETGLYYLKNRYYRPVWARFVTADRGFYNVYNVLGNNLYAYCSNQVICVADNSGCDAYWITDTDGAATMGHVSLLIEDHEGHWYYFYWGAESGIVGKPEVIFTEVKDIIGTNGYLSLELLNLAMPGVKGDEERTYERATLFRGDFTPSMELANHLLEFFEGGEGKDMWAYSVVAVNCMDVSAIIMAESSDSEEMCLFWLNHYTNGVIPNLCLPSVEGSGNWTHPRQ